MTAWRLMHQVYMQRALGRYIFFAEYGVHVRRGRLQKSGIAYLLGGPERFSSKERNCCRTGQADRRGMKNSRRHCTRQAVWTLMFGTLGSAGECEGQCG